MLSLKFGKHNLYAAYHSQFGHMPNTFPPLQEVLKNVPKFAFPCDTERYT